MGINKALGTFSVTVFCREVTYFACFSLNSLRPKTMEMIVNLKYCLCSVDLVNFKLIT